MRRFYLTNINSPTWQLDGDEAHHLSKVLRAKKGDHFKAFDGQGHECIGQVVEIGRREISLKAIGNIEAIDRRPARDMRVAVAFPKARSRGFIMEKLVELGVREVQPLLCERGVDAPDPDRLLAQALTALKQCGINTLPKILPAIDIKKFLVQDNANPTLLHPEGASNTPEHETITLIVGPEGGFSPQELQCFECPRWSLGKQVLRTETACMAALARLG
jgi:16S rRNA (uracil1498-N3)-methyltransferase